MHVIKMHVFIRQNWIVAELGLELGSYSDSPLSMCGSPSLVS